MIYHMTFRETTILPHRPLEQISTIMSFGIYFGMEKYFPHTKFPGYLKFQCLATRLIKGLIVYVSILFYDLFSVYHFGVWGL